jgi:hypothetical protein
MPPAEIEHEDAVDVHPAGSYATYSLSACIRRPRKLLTNVYFVPTPIGRVVVRRTSRSDRATA